MAGLRLPVLATLAALAAGALAPPSDSRSGRADPYGLKPAGHEAHRARAAERHAEALRQHQGDDGFLVLPGVVADRGRRRLEVAVERSAVEPNAPCEFLVVAETSDHTYESLFIAFARPSDVQRGLEFIGLRPGQPPHPAGMRMWARGEAVRLRIEGATETPAIPETWLADRRTGQPLPETRYLFTGSPAMRDGAGRLVPTADVRQPQAIAPMFNTDAGVLEIAARARKEVVYQNTVIRPGAPPAEGLLALVLEPLAPAGETRVRDLDLRVEPAGTPPPAGAGEADLLRSLRIRLKEGDRVLLEASDLPRLLERLALLDRERRDWFMTVTLDPALSLAQARALAGVLALVDSDRGVRLEPPPPGSLHPLVFRPARSWLDRDHRLLHPLELELELPDTGVERAVLFHSRTVTRPGTSHADLEVTAVPVPGPAALRDATAAIRLRTEDASPTADAPVVLVFAPSAAPVGRLTDWLAPLRSSHPTVQVFLDEPETVRPRLQSRRSP